MVARVRSRRGRRDGRRAPRHRPRAAGRWCAPSRTARRGRHPGRRGRGGGPRRPAGPPARCSSCGSSWSGTSTPASPTAVGSPPTAAATTGVPLACASTATSPNDSLYDGTATRSALRYHWTSCSRATGGTNRTCASIPSRAARRCSWRGVSRPVPLGPPSDRHDQVGAQLGPAREQVGGGAQQHVRGLERLDPADEQQHAGAAGRPVAARAAARSPGVNSSRSTPGGTTRTLPGSASYSSTSWRASSSVLATSRSAASTTCASPISRPGGSGVSPSAS